ncbi:hypothetical protein PVAND_015517 [Polypedilum vanderplanki]|uniref:Uncharacterized protein n=1 Tax=Polypedilum vanderplanki TaxID=319348 RepID=A0A9J6BCV4_POLVA|nr:hypothetical protein PVAND_015517 [Polypedilum vanderplanki]
MNRKIIFTLFLIPSSFSLSIQNHSVKCSGANALDVNNFKSLKPNTTFKCFDYFLDNNRNVTKLTFKQNNEINFFPKFAEDKFENVQSITMKSVFLLEINSDDLKPFKKIHFISLDSNLIRILPKNLFQHNKNLEMIILSNNRIQLIHPTAFDNLNNLKTLDLTNNICISKTFDATKDFMIERSSCIKAQKNKSKDKKNEKECVSNKTKTEKNNDKICESQKHNFYLSLTFNVIQFIIIISILIIIGYIKFKKLPNVEESLNQSTTIAPIYSDPHDFLSVQEEIYEEPVNTLKRKNKNLN